MPHAAFEHTKAGAAKFAAWFTQMPELIYLTRSTKVFREQFTQQCSLCVAGADSFDEALAQGDSMKGDPRFVKAISRTKRSATEVDVFVYWHFNHRVLTDGNGNVTNSSNDVDGRYFYRVIWVSDRWKIADMELAK